jgi:hypothetical protein
MPDKKTRNFLCEKKEYENEKPTSTHLIQHTHSRTTTITISMSRKIYFFQSFRHRHELRGEEENFHVIYSRARSTQRHGGWLFHYMKFPSFVVVVFTEKRPMYNKKNKTLGKKKENFCLIINSSEICFVCHKQKSLILLVAF